MRHVLTSLLTLHWAIAFALLAFVCVDGSRGVVTAFAMLGVESPGAALAALENGAAAAPFAIAFLLVALLFCWAFVETLVDDAGNASGADRVMTIAFAAAPGPLTLMLITGTAGGFSGLYLAVAVQLAALLASYVAIVTERGWVSDNRRPVDVEILGSARAMARSAAHASTLGRISRRGPVAGEGDS